MPMILLRCMWFNCLAGTTGGPWRPLSVDQVLSRTYKAPGHIVMCWLSHSFYYCSSNHNGPMATQSVHFKKCNGLCGQFRGCASPEDVVFGVYMTQQQKMFLVWKLEIIKKIWYSVSLVAKPLAHYLTFSHVPKFKLLFNLYPVRIQTDICNQNSLHRLSGDSKQLTSPMHRLPWAARNIIFYCINIVRCPWWFWSSSVTVDLSLYDLSCGLSHEFWT